MKAHYKISKNLICQNTNYLTENFCDSSSYLMQSCETIRISGIDVGG